MVALIVTVFLAALISALCSTTEAMLYSVPWTHIEKMRESQKPSGILLHELKSNVNKPITAVLTLNTMANTAGSALAGALATTALGPENLVWFTVGFTVLILIVGEVLPKNFGVAYANQLSTILAYPLKGMVILFTPFIWLSSFVTRLISPSGNSPDATEDDIRIMAKMSCQQGEIEAFEETIISNILNLDKKYVHQVMTPRTVVFSLPVDMPLNEATKVSAIWHFSRIPLYRENNEDIVGIVTRRDLSLYLSGTGGSEDGKTLESLMQKITFIPESQTLDKTLMAFLGSRQHLAAVLDEYGGLAGVVTLEDILEEMLGREIVDESDVVTDLRAIAKNVSKINDSL